MTEQAAPRAAAEGRPREQAYDRLKRRLMAGEILPGEMVSLRDLVKRLDLPLAAVREALSRLEGEGLVRVFPKRGIQVCPVDMSFMREAFQLRLILEREGVAVLAAAAEQPALPELERRLRRLREAAAAAVTPAVQAEAISVDRALHDAIIGALESGMITALYGQVRDRLLLVRAATRLPLGGMVLAATEEHLDIVGALLRRDQAAAGLALTRHLDAAMRRQIGIW